MGPGWTLLTVMPLLPTSLDNAWVNIFTAPFVAAYATSPGVETRSPTADPVMMMRPPFFMCFSAACVAAIAPRTLMSITRSISSSVVVSKVFGIAVPALFTSTSSRPKVATVFSTAPLTASTSAASAWIAIAFPPSSSIAFTTADAALASFAYVIATLAPSAARRLAIAAPMPREPPVTTATLPANFCPLLLLISFVPSLFLVLRCLSVRTGRRFLNHRGDIFDALAVRPTVFLHDCHHFFVMFLARPVALEFQQHLERGKRHGPSLLNAANRRVVRGLARAARSVLDGIDAIALLQHLQRRKHQARFAPECGDQEVVPCGALHSGDKFLVFPRV